MVDTEFWNAVVPDEEVDHDDERLNRMLRWRELERHLDGVRTILDVGGGTGAFSIPLAERGFDVTHLDISPAMLAAARARSSWPIYVEGAAQDLSRFGDRHFDLVLNTDGAVSFAGSDWTRVLAESCRVGKKLFLTVSDRSAMTATWLKYALRSGHVGPAAREMLRNGHWDKDQFPENDRIYPAICDIPRFKAFTHAELAAALAVHDYDVLTMRAIGSLSHLMLAHGLKIDDVDLAEEFDVTFPAGPGSFRRAGLFAVGRHRKG